MCARRFPISALALGVVLAGCLGDALDGPPPSLDRIAAELGAPPPDTIWLREGDLDGPMCVLRVEMASTEGIRAVPGADADPDAGLLMGRLDGRLTGRLDGVPAPGDSGRVEVGGTACAAGVYGDRPAEGDGTFLVTDTTGGRTVGAFAADLSAVGGRFSRAGRAVRVLGTVHLAPEPVEVAP